MLAGSFFLLLVAPQQRTPSCGVFVAFQRCPVGPPISTWPVPALLGFEGG